VARTKLNVTLDQFLDLTMSEVIDLLSEKAKHNSCILLDQALYVTLLFGSDKLENKYKEILDSISGVNKKAELEKNYKRYKMISERLGLKFPNIKES